MLWVLICVVHLTVCSYHVIYAFQSESTLYSCLSFKELLAQNRSDTWSSFINYVVVGPSSVAVTSTSDIACFKQGVPWHSGHYRVWIHSEMRTWHDKNIQYLSCFAVILRGIHRNIDICQTVYNTSSLLEFSPYSEIIHGCTFKLTKC